MKASEGGTTFDVDAIAAGAQETRSYADGSVIYRSDERGGCAYIVKSGQVEIREKGRSVEMVSPGEIFGELALLDDEPRTATALASGRAEVIPIDRPLFEVLMRDDPEFALTIVRLLARSLRATMRMLESCVEDLKTSDGGGPVRRVS
jgi:CRP/FNR family cyclic AMP-dependent transcriptional regulator